MKDSLLASLRDYQRRFPEESATAEAFFTFVDAEESCFERTLEKGHITGSAFVLNKNRTHILLTLHAKLHKWVQLGGHADGHPLVHEVALKEAHEESGLIHLALLDAEPFDLDIHEIVIKNTPSHLHYDVRYLVMALSEDEPVISEESLDLKWVPLEKIHQYTEEESILRPIRKILSLA